MKYCLICRERMHSAWFPFQDKPCVKLTHEDGHEVYLCKRCFDLPIAMLSPSEMRERELAEAGANQ